MLKRKWYLCYTKGNRVMRIQGIPQMRKKGLDTSFPTNGGIQPATTLKEKHQIKFKVVKNEK